MNNPILSRELKSNLRSKRSQWLLAIYLLTLSALIIIFWPSEGMLSITAAHSRQLFTYFFSGQLLLILFFSPAFTATAITSEKEAGSFDMLFCSLMSPLEICLGKLIGAISFLILLIVAALPLIGICFLLGSVSLHDILRATTILLLSALSFGLIGLINSALFRRSSSALLASYCSVLTLSFGILLPSFFINTSPSLAYPIHLIRSCSPLTALLEVVQPQFWSLLGEKATADFPASFSLFIMAHSTIIALALIYLAIILRKPPQNRARTRKLATPKMGFPFYIINPHKPGSYIGNWTNPIFIKELRTRFFGRLPNTIRGTTTCFIFSLTMVIIASSGVGELSNDVVKIIGTTFQLGIVLFLSPILTAGLITQEREAHTFTLLRTTPLRAHTIIIGKLLSALFYLVILIAASAPFFFMIWFLDVGNATRTVQASLMILLAMLFGTSTGLACSAFSRRSSDAMARSYTIIIALALIPFITLILSDKLTSATTHTILSLTPFIGTLSLVCDNSLAEYPYWQGSMITMLILSALFLGGAVVKIHLLMRRH
jgi:ABC-type transport system involved in multi-copper enzyme maturation permease subunit